MGGNGGIVATTVCRIFGHSRHRGSKFAMPEGVPSLFRWCKRCNAWTNWYVTDPRFIQFNFRIRVPDEGHQEQVGPILSELPAAARTPPPLPEATSTLLNLPTRLVERMLQMEMKELPAGFSGMTPAEDVELNDRSEQLGLELDFEPDEPDEPDFIEPDLQPEPAPAPATVLYDYETHEIFRDVRYSR